MRDIGLRAFALATSPDEGRKSGILLAKALALAAVQVIEGEARDSSAVSAGLERLRRPAIEGRTAEVVDARPGEPRPLASLRVVPRAAPAAPPAVRPEERPRRRPGASARASRPSSRTGSRCRPFPNRRSGRPATARRRWPGASIAPNESSAEAPAAARHGHRPTAVADDDLGRHRQVRADRAGHAGIGELV